MGNILPTLISVNGEALRAQLRLPSLSLAGRISLIHSPTPTPRLLELLQLLGESTRVYCLLLQHRR